MYAHMPGCLEGGPSSSSPDSGGGRWYFSRKELEEDSPSRRDGIDLKKETYLRKSYCTYLQDLGMRLKVPQVTIATAIIFCHRFFLRQSHAMNDRRSIATVCMFLAGKVEETPRPLKDVILVSYEIIQKKDPAAAQRIKQKEVYEQQKEQLLVGERVVLATLGFDLNVHHPYKPLVEAIKKLKVAQNALAQVAWNFVNDGLRTSLCLQFKPHHIAAGAIFLAAKFLKVKLPSDGEKVWWQEFDVTPRQLEEVSNQMLELYEQNRVPPSQGSEVEESTTGGPNSRSSAKVVAVNEKQTSVNSHAQAVGAASTVKSGTSKPLSSSGPVLNYGHPDKARSSFNESNNDNGSTELSSVVTDQKVDTEKQDSGRSEELSHKEVSCKSDIEDPKMFKSSSEREDQERNGARKGSTEVGEMIGNSALEDSKKVEFRGVPLGQSSHDAIKMIDKDKVKAAIEKRKKARGEMNHGKNVIDEDDLIERELEDGIELAVKDEKMRQQQDRRQSWSKSENPVSKDQDAESKRHLGKKGQSPAGGGGGGGAEGEKVEEGEMVDNAAAAAAAASSSSSPLLRSCKRKGSPLSSRQSDGKKRQPSLA